MKIDFAQTKNIVEECWKIACTASLPGIGEMPQGNGQLNSVRWQLFQQLVAQLVPNHQKFEGNTKGALEVVQPKEDWEQ